MAAALARAPLWVVLLGVLSASMYVPAVHATIRDAHAEARAFFYAGTLLMALCAGVGVALARDRAEAPTRDHLLSLLLVALIGPVLAAVPFAEAVPDTRPVNAWLEMVASGTTTGGAIFAPERLSPTLHLWRALVAWQGGLMIWIAAAAILAPLRLGGFEVLERDDARMRVGRSARPQRRVRRVAASLVPIYGALTLALWLLLAAVGTPPTDAAIHAMSTLSTSGIVGATPFEAGAGGLAGEVAVFGFLLFAVSRATFTADLYRGDRVGLREDRELRIAATLVAAVAVALFARHWVGAFEVDMAANARAAAGAVWGAAFTALSFLTTTGFVSAEWDATRAWSGLGNGQVLLLGLAMFGGGVATTAGGVKLLRIYALYTHGRREMRVLVHPHAIDGDIRRHRITPGGIEAAWVFFMLFALGLAAATLGLAATGIGFETALTLAVAGLSTTGPLADGAFPPGQGPLTLPDAAKVVYAAAMLVGRLEALALIALFNPDFWRR